MNTKAYIRESARTAANNFHPDVVDIIDFRDSLDQTLGQIEYLDSLKKALFYRKTYDLSDPICPATHEDFNTAPMDIIHAFLGIVTEGGELLEKLDDNLTRGYDIEKHEVKDELGDLLWYMAMVLRYYGWSFEEVMAQNIKKLYHRFPHAFDEELAANKDAESEQQMIGSR